MILVVAAVISAISTILASASMPSASETESGSGDGKPSLQRRHSLDGKVLWRRLIWYNANASSVKNNQMHQVRLMLAYKSCISFSSSLFHTMIPVILLSQQYQLGPADNGWIFSYIGVIVVVAQLIFNRLYLTANSSCTTVWSYDLRWLAGASALMTASFAGIALLAADLWRLTLWLIPLMSAGTVIFTLSTSMLTRMVDPRMIGSLIGLDMAVTGVLRVIAPLLGTWLSAWFGDESIGLCCSLFVAISIPMLFAFRIQ
jgi:hypothetical protein